jgi:hypothetical protein
MACIMLLLFEFLCNVKQEYLYHLCHILGYAIYVSTIVTRTFSKHKIHLKTAELHFFYLHINMQSHCNHRICAC